VIYPHQAERLTEALERGRFEALVAASSANVAYVTGFRSLTRALYPSAEFAMFTRHGTALVLPAADVPAAVADAPDVDHVVCYGACPASFPESLGPEARRVQAILANTGGDVLDALVSALALLGVRGGAIGLDESGLAGTLWPRVIERLGEFDVVAASGHLGEARRVKAPYEIECLDHALRIAEQSVDAVIQALDRGMTERDAAALYTAEVGKRGAVAWPALVATGQRTSIPGPWPTDRALRLGDLVRLGVGCTYKGYSGSVARTAVLGEPTPSMDETCVALLAGLDAATAAISPGARSGRVAEAAAQAAKTAGVPGLDLLGHGTGLEPRETPAIEPGGAVVLEQGEVLRLGVARFHIGSIGLSIADTILVTNAGARLMNRSRHDLIVLD